MKNFIEPEEFVSNSISLYNPLYNPSQYVIKYDNVTHYALTYMQKHFKSVAVNEDFSYATISNGDVKRFLKEIELHLIKLYENCPNNIDREELCNLILIDDTIKVVDTGLSGLIHNVMNKGWSSTLLVGGYSDIVFAQTLPGNGYGLYQLRPTSILTVATIGGLFFSIASTLTPYGPVKRVFRSVSKVLLLPATAVEVSMNFVIGKTVAKIWPQTMNGIKFNVTKAISSGPGASISDYQESTVALEKFCRKSTGLLYDFNKWVK